MNCISHTGPHAHVRRARRRADDAGLARSACRSPARSPNRSSSPSVTLNAPPYAPMSSPMQKTFGSRSISSNRPCADRLEIGRLSHRGVPQLAGRSCRSTAAPDALADTRAPAPRADRHRRRPAQSRGSGGGDRSATSVASSISRLHPRVDRLQLLGADASARREPLRCSGRADRSRGPTGRSRRPGTYDWLSCSAWPFRR